jgi:nitrite reductase/ring-hydroxylating ferredoxin subunit
MADKLRYEFSPPYVGSRVDHVGTYKRNLPVNLDRMYENALDWEHLPYLHKSSFTEIICETAGAWGWRCRVVDARGRESLLELSLDRSCRRWVTRNLEGPSVGAEIWTHVFVTDHQAMDLVIDFFVPGVPEENREKVGQAYARAYEMLYDEDVWMMSERQQRIDERVDAVRETDSVEFDVPDEGSLPLAVNLSGRHYFLHRDGEDWLVYPQACPHQMGPLGRPDEAGHVRCPWHGYAFDVRTGESTTGANCSFGRRPTVTPAGDKLRLAWAKTEG